MSPTAPTWPATPRILPINELFTGAVTGLWATSYSVDLSLFNEFLLARLGEPPLNIAVLVDHRRLATSLERIPAERAETLTAVNRNWLLRAVHAPAAFHPKSYLAVTGSTAKLLVGSGNLTGDGLNEGHEVFTAFTSDTAIGVAAITTWRAWIRRLVTLVGDTTLAHRLQDLESRIPSPAAIAPANPSPLLHNLDTPLADQLATRLTAADIDVEELRMTAPFYDEDGAAVGTLLDMLNPRRVTLFIHPSTKVDGHRLATRLKASGAQVTVMEYEPDAFVHAKLVAVIGKARAWLLSGSANLSRAALTLTPHTGGNIELAVLTPLDPEKARTLFIPDDLRTAERPLDTLTALTYQHDPEPDPPPVRLMTAAARPGGRIEITTAPSPGDGWLLHDLTARQPLIPSVNARALTAGPLTGRLVQIVAADGSALSNRAVVDDPDALAAALTASSTRPGTDRPDELTSGDLESTLGRELQLLHHNLVMDVNEQAAPTQREAIGGAEADGDTDDDLWSRLEKEQLIRDPRAGNYAHMWAGQALDHTEPIIQLLDDLRARTPTQTATGPESLLALLVERATVTAELDTPPRQWHVSTRIRIRARNLLRRWAGAQNDPRLLWIDPLAPAKNFATITGTLAHLRLIAAQTPQQVELTAADLDDLWQQWLQPIAGTGRGDGWLDTLNTADRTRVAEQLPRWLKEATAALCWIIVRPGPSYRDRVIPFQPLLTATLSHDLVEPTEMTARYLSALTRENLTRDNIDAALIAAVDFIDDDLWCTREAERLKLPSVTLESPPGANGIAARVGVRGVKDPLADSRIPQLAVDARNYRRCDGIAVHSLDEDWRLVFKTGEKVIYLPRKGGETDEIESPLPLAQGTLESLTSTSGTLNELMIG